MLSVLSHAGCVVAAAVAAAALAALGREHRLGHEESSYPETTARTKTQWVSAHGGGGRGAETWTNHLEVLFC